MVKSSIRWYCEDIWSIKSIIMFSIRVTSVSLSITYSNALVTQPRIPWLQKPLRWILMFISESAMAEEHLRLIPPKLKVLVSHVVCTNDRHKISAATPAFSGSLSSVKSISTFADRPTPEIQDTGRYTGNSFISHSRLESNRYAHVAAPKPDSKAM